MNRTELGRESQQPAEVTKPELKVAALAAIDQATAALTDDRDFGKAVVQKKLAQIDECGRTPFPPEDVVFSKESNTGTPETHTVGFENVPHSYSLRWEIKTGTAQATSRESIAVWTEKPHVGGSSLFVGMKYEHTNPSTGQIVREVNTPAAITRVNAFLAKRAPKPTK